MALPYQFVVPLLGQALPAPRQLKLPVQHKAGKYLELVELLLRRFPSESNARAAKFLLDLCRVTDPGLPAPVSWFMGQGRPDLIQIGQPGVVRRIAPTMRFEARFARR